MTALRTAKELVRHALHQLQIDRIYYKLRGRPRPFLEHSDLRLRFSEIYKSGHWQLGKSETPLSGHGSSLEATDRLRAELPKILKDSGVTRLLDIGCGDFTWMSKVDLQGLYYHGIDVVPEVVANNQRRYGSEHVLFSVANAAGEALPAADAVLCREVLFHLSFADAKALLRSALATGAQHFLLTTDTGTSFNADIHSGDYRLLNLQIGPFKLPPPKRSIPEIEPGRILGVWTAADIGAALAG